MFAKKVLVVQFAGDRPGFSIDQKRVRRHPRNVFENDGMVSGGGGLDELPSQPSAPAKTSDTTDSTETRRRFETKLIKNPPRKIKI